MKFLVSLGGAVLASAIGPVMAIGSLPAADHGLILALVMPWQDPQSLALAAGGVMVGPSAAPIAALVYGDKPGFADLLMKNGALATLDGQLFAVLCGV